jgi:hypothetical protein
MPTKVLLVDDSDGRVRLTGGSSAPGQPLHKFERG